MVQMVSMCVPTSDQPPPLFQGSRSSSNPPPQPNSHNPPFLWRFLFIFSSCLLFSPLLLLSPLFPLLFSAQCDLLWIMGCAISTQRPTPSPSGWWSGSRNGPHHPLSRRCLYFPTTKVYRGGLNRPIFSTSKFVTTILTNIFPLGRNQVLKVASSPPLFCTKQFVIFFLPPKDHLPAGVMYAR